MNFNTSLNASVWSLRVNLIFLTTVLLGCFAAPIMGANQVAIYTAGELYGGDDTLWNGGPTYLAILIENDYVLGGMSLGFRFYSPDGVVWEWNQDCDPPAIACAVPGSRADPDPWDMTELIVTLQNVDGISPDTVMIGGVAMTNGLPTGPLEHLYSIYFTPLSPGEGLTTLCVDSAFVPPSGAFVFVNTSGGASPPTTLWPPGGKCWPIGGHYHCWAEWDEELPTEMDVDHCGNNSSVTLSASHFASPVTFELHQLNGGAGQAEVIDNGDGTCEVVYTAAAEDMGQEITIVVNADCDACPSTNSLYELSVVAINNPPSLDIGSYYNWGATNNLITNNDIIGSDEDECDEITYSHISGPGQIDPQTGVYTWMPGLSDIGEYFVTIAVSDGYESTQDEFHVGVVDEACCPGDANASYTCNVGDAVYLLNYIFGGGPRPRVMNWADANFDCQVNVGDVVYIIAYVFQSGPAPEVGCYY